VKKKLWKGHLGMYFLENSRTIQLWNNGNDNFGRQLSLGVAAYENS
jgi:hypothetical protein